MKVNFSKYQGTGNDFILINNLSGVYSHIKISQIQHLCDRKFGIGADGLIFINKSKIADFEVVYFNSDGSKSFCGNGGRCAVSFAKKIGLIESKTTFEAIDGIHVAYFQDKDVCLQMINVEKVILHEKDYELNTGSPHFIKFVNNAHQVDVVTEGGKIRNSTEYKEKGINVNFVEIVNKNELEVVTYERGVEDETLSCGTGITAASIAYSLKNNLLGFQEITIHSKGGKLKVKFNKTTKNTFEDVFLIGPAEFVFEGIIDLI
jgi:diaminopimelate epimerase